MRRLPAALLLLLAPLALGLALRLPRLDQRPLHADEAVHAVKFGRFLEGCYRYDPHEYHGPTLYSLTLPVYALSGAKKWADAGPAVYRLTTVGCGLLLLLLTWGLGGGRGWRFWAALLAALSPALVIYSRWYVQEMPLLLFTLALLVSLVRFRAGGKSGWALAAGAAAGAMYATKETSLLVFLALGLALAGERLWRRRAGGPPPSWRWRGLWPALPAALVLAVLLLSCFGRDWTGPLDSLAAYTDYLDRGRGGEATHNHPWYFYLERLFWYRREGAPRFSEGLVLLLALLGSGCACTGRGLGRVDRWTARLLALYALGLTGIYCAIPYKTPWCLLGFHHALILLAGIGAAALVRTRPRWVGAVLLVGLAGGCWHLADRALLARGPLCCHGGNPFLYAWTSPDTVRLARRVEELAACHPRGREMPVQVAFPDHYYWPLPWYLRRMRNVGYYGGPPPSPRAPVVVTGGPEAVTGNGERHLSLFGLRPGVILHLSVEKQLWEAFLARRAGPVRLHHRAMGTSFRLDLCGHPPAYARQAGREAWERLDTLESVLSPYNPNGGPARIAALEPGEKLVLAPDLHRCLRLARQAWQLTGGAFDPTRAQQAMRAIRLDPATWTVSTTRKGVDLDLGGIGKGFALDRIAELLREWRIAAALLHGGHSSVLALGPPPGRAGWSLDLPHPHRPGERLKRLTLAHRALGASGTGRRGPHILSPFTGRPVTARRSAWALAPTAAEADALATAFMVMPLAGIEALCARRPDLAALVVASRAGGGAIHEYGRWP